MKKSKNINYPIDVVIPWVDGNDINWKKERNKYRYDETSSVHHFDYQDWGLLKYWFRGIEKYAPWVRNVFFITWGHVPEWLNINHPKLKIINHEDFIPEKYLPTFSSHTIELNFFRIKELSEHFVYFNDDMYLINQTKPEDFFKNGLPKDCAIQNPITPLNNNCISHLQLTTIAVINQNFKKNEIIKNNIFKWFNFRYRELILLNMLFAPWNRFPGLLEQHVASSLLKSTYKSVWKKEYNLMDKTCSHKFRDFKVDVNQWILKEWQIASGNFEPRDINFGKLLSIYDVSSALKAKFAITNSNRKVLCINDHVNENNIDEIKTIVKNGFEIKFPNKSSYEK